MNDGKKKYKPERSNCVNGYLGLHFKNSRSGAIDCNHSSKASKCRRPLAGHGETHTFIFDFFQHFVSLRILRRRWFTRCRRRNRAFAAKKIFSVGNIWFEPLFQRGDLEANLQGRRGRFPFQFQLTTFFYFCFYFLCFFTRRLGNVQIFPQ